MKTYKQFTYDMQEGVLNNPVTRFVGKTYNKIQPLKNITRFTNIKKLKNNPNMSLVDKASTIAGVIAPYSLPAYAKDIVQSGKTDSALDKTVNFIGKQNNKVPQLPFAGKRKVTNRTDLGKKIGDFLGFNKKDTYGASDLKGTTSGMG